MNRNVNSAVLLAVVVLLLVIVVVVNAIDDPEVPYSVHDILAGQMRQPKAEQYCFLSFGCWGGKNRKTQAAVAAAMEKDAATSAPLFVIAAGDNFYPSGVKSAGDPRIRATFESVYRGPLLPIPWFVALGNHDYRGNFSAQVQYTFDREHNKHRRWYLPAPYYSSRELGGFPSDLLMVVLDGPLLERCHNNGDAHERCYDHGRQRRWLQELLEADQRDFGFRWRVVVCHYPMYANGPHINFGWLKSWLQPLLEKYCVSLYINADNHYLQVSQLNDVFYVNSGGGAGYGLRHTPRDKGYRKDEHSVWEKIADGFVRHCVSNSNRGSVADGGAALVDEHSELVSTFVSEAGEELFSFTAKASRLRQKCQQNNRAQAAALTDTDAAAVAVVAKKETETDATTSSIASAQSTDAPSIGGATTSSSQPEIWLVVAALCVSGTAILVRRRGAGSKSLNGSRRI